MNYYWNKLFKSNQSEIYKQNMKNLIEKIKLLFLLIKGNSSFIYHKYLKNTEMIKLF